MTLVNRETAFSILQEHYNCRLHTRIVNKRLHLVCDSCDCEFEFNGSIEGDIQAQ